MSKVNVCCWAVGEAEGGWWWEWWEGRMWCGGRGIFIMRVDSAATGTFACLSASTWDACWSTKVKAKRRADGKGLSGYGSGCDHACRGAAGVMDELLSCSIGDALGQKQLGARSANALSHPKSDQDSLVEIAMRDGSWVREIALGCGASVKRTHSRCLTRTGVGSDRRTL